MGVIISSDLSWSKHVEEIVNKVNKVLGLITRIVGNRNKDVFSLLYKSLVRPILEYACPLWDPHLVKNIKAVEAVQRRASRIALGQKRQEMPYEERCKILNWSSLERRREFLSLIECYKTVFDMNGINFTDHFEFCKSKKTRANHPYKLQTKSTRIDCHKYSFFVRIIKLWNNLPSDVVNSVDEPNISIFKARLKKYMNIC